MRTSRLPNLCRVALGVLFVAPSAACIGSTEPEPYEPQVIEEITFAASLEIDLAQMTETEVGVYVQDLVVGDGDEVQVGTIYSADYAGWLNNGFQFDTGTLDESTLGNPPTIGTNQLIPGLEFGMLGMQPGGTRLIIIPPELAYGQPGFGLIPGGAVLVFLIEMITASGS